jgi:hypothetical protein
MIYLFASKRIFLSDFRIKANCLSEFNKESKQMRHVKRQKKNEYQANKIRICLYFLRSEYIFKAHIADPTHKVQLHSRGTEHPHELQQHPQCTAAPTRYSCTYRYSYTYEVQLHLWGTAAPTRYSCTYRYSYTYEVQLHLWGTAALVSYTYEVQLHLRGTGTPMR